MSDNISSIGDATRRMTYAEMADIRRISVASAERLVRRKRWVRTTGNDGIVRVLVPLEEARKPPPRTKPIRRSAVSGQADSQGDKPAVRILEEALSALNDQLARERERADRAEQRIDELQALLTEERRRVIEILTRPWWRKWFR